MHVGSFQYLLAFYPVLGAYTLAVSSPTNVTSVAPLLLSRRSSTLARRYVVDEPNFDEECEEFQTAGGLYEYFEHNKNKDKRCFHDNIYSMWCKLKFPRRHNNVVEYDDYLTGFPCKNDTLCFTVKKGTTDVVEDRGRYKFVTDIMCLLPDATDWNYLRKQFQVWQSQRFQGPVGMRDVNIRMSFQGDWEGEEPFTVKVDSGSGVIMKEEAKYVFTQQQMHGTYHTWTYGFTLPKPRTPSSPEPGVSVTVESAGTLKHAISAWAWFAFTSSPALVDTSASVEPCAGRECRDAIEGP